MLLEKVIAQFLEFSGIEVSYVRACMCFPCKFMSKQSQRSQNWTVVSPYDKKEPLMYAVENREHAHLTNKMLNGFTSTEKRAQVDC